MSNPYGWQSCGGSHGANLAARQSASEGRGSSGSGGSGGGGGDGNSLGSQFFTILILSGLAGWIGDAVHKGRGPVVGIIAFVLLFLMWRSKNRAESQSYHSDD